MVAKNRDREAVSWLVLDVVKNMAKTLAFAVEGGVLAICSENRVSSGQYPGFPKSPAAGRSWRNLRFDAPDVHFAEVFKRWMG